MTDHHPAFEKLLETRRAEGITVQRVQYRQDHPDYQGGRYIEVYVGPGNMPDGRVVGECVDPDFSPDDPERDLDSCLEEAVRWCYAMEGLAALGGDQGFGLTTR